MMRRHLLRLLVLLLLAEVFSVAQHAHAQPAKSTALPEALKKVSKAFGTEFFYDKELLQGKTTSYNFDNLKGKQVEEVLKAILYPQGFLFVYIKSNYYTIVPRDRVGEAAGMSLLQGRQQEPVVTATASSSLHSISGLVVSNNKPVQGVSISAQLAGTGAVSDVNGRFSVNVKQRDALTVTSVGYQTQEINLSNQTSLRVDLTALQRQLDEVVVIGYGTTTKRKSTGSVSSITAEEISKQPVANPLNALQGRVAGAIVNQANGLPGSRVTIQIRGQNSLNSGQQPLYIIDGVPFNIQDGVTPVTNDLNGRGLFGANRGISPFSTINPADIERIDVLKDADATAIYGTRGANGVVLITTKKGKAGKTKVDFNLYNGFGKVGHFIDMLNTAQYRQLRKDAIANDGLTPNPASDPDLLSWDSANTTDWQHKYLGGTAKIFDAQATISGGDVRTRFLFGAGYHDETTVFPGSFGDKRISVRFNADHSSLDRKFNANISANYSYDKNDLLNTDLSNVYNLPPNLPLRNADGTLYWDANFDNPEAYLLQKFTARTNNLISNAQLRYTLLPGLDIKTSLGFNRLSLDQNLQNPATAKNPFSGTPTNSARFATVEQQGYIIEPQATYTKKLGDGNLSALLGSTFQSSVAKSAIISADNYSNPNLLTTPNGAGIYTAVTASYTLYRYNSVFGRVTYDWKSKYLLNGVIRRDGSSRFGANNRFGTFWSAGAGWVFSNEKGIADALPFLSFGKLRGSYGLTGNDQLPDYQYVTLFTASSGTLAYQGSSILLPNRINNPTLQWETNKKAEAGIDLGLFKDRLQLTVNYYRNRTGNQLGSLKLATQAGFNSYQANFDAVIRNQGLEVEINSSNIRTAAFEWKTSFNITAPGTKLISASPQYFSFNQASLGQPLSYVLALKYKGVDPQTGNSLYRDAAKDSLTYTPNFTSDAAVTGYKAPRFYGGLSNSFSYKGLELSFFFQFTKQEGNILNGNVPGALYNGNADITWLNRWRKPGDVTILPKATTNSDGNYGSSDAIWGDASYIRLRNVEASYSFPAALAKKMKMDNLRLFVQGQNLKTWTKNKYVSDPETIATTNQAPVVMQPLRVITFGINCTF